MLPEIDDFDWQKAFECCGKEHGPEDPDDWQTSYDNEPGVSMTDGYKREVALAKKQGVELPGDAWFTREDVVEVLAIDDGENDEADWVGMFALADGRYAYVEAGCDYTGWD